MIKKKMKIKNNVAVSIVAVLAVCVLVCFYELHAIQDGSSNLIFSFLVLDILVEMGQRDDLKWQFARKHLYVLKVCECVRELFTDKF